MIIIEKLKILTKRYGIEKIEVKKAKTGQNWLAMATQRGIIIKEDITKKEIIKMVKSFEKRGYNIASDYGFLFLILHEIAHKIKHHPENWFNIQIKQIIEHGYEKYLNDENLKNERLNLYLSQEKEAYEWAYKEYQHIKDKDLNLKNDFFIKNS
ncbi:MAG: hypothetical protein JRI44_00955 [Deltaproteobacteria bacterium]|nr:hypothetical protein [Deltaproteobacteria bacterium]